MSTIFPLSASAGQVFNGYTFNGTSWDINGIDLNTNYLEESSASATYLTQVSASTTYQPKVTNVSDTEIGYLDGVTSGIQSQIDSKLAASSASTTYLPLSAATANQLVYKNSSNVATGSSGLTYDGTSIKVNGNLESIYHNGDEGGEIFLHNPDTNTTLSNGVTIDVFRDKLRIFENGGNNRGGYIDLGTLPNGVNTNLVPGMTLVKKQTVGSGVTSVVVNDAFSSTYDNYEILWTGGTMTSSSGDSQLYLSLNGATGSDYTTHLRYTNGTTMNVASQTTTRFMWIGGGSTGSGLMQIKLYAPYLSVHTRSESHAYNSWNNVYFGSSNGVHAVSGSYTGFTVNVSGTGTMSNGTIRVYGYNNG